MENYFLKYFSNIFLKIYDFFPQQKECQFWNDMKINTF